MNSGQWPLVRPRGKLVLCGGNLMIFPGSIVARMALRGQFNAN
jgi:hypothetical protein